MNYVFLGLFFSLSCSLFAQKAEQLKPPVRLILYGGAREINAQGLPHSKGISHNNTFGAAAFQLKKEYLLGHPSHRVKVVKVESGGEVAEIFANQQQGSVVSVDFLTHGGSSSLNMSKCESRNCGIYAQSKGKVFAEKIHHKGYQFTDEARDLTQWNWAMLADSARIEFHSCHSATHNFVTPTLTRYCALVLHSQGKDQVRVIGHLGKSSPRISARNRTCADYRHRLRLVFWNGRLQRISLKKGAI